MAKGGKGKIRINVNDVIGKCLGKLEVIEYAGCKYSDTKGGLRMRHYYKCECSCGRTTIIRRASLKNELVQSCGCIRGRYRGN